LRAILRFSVAIACLLSSTAAYAQLGLGQPGGGPGGFGAPPPGGGGGGKKKAAAAPTKPGEEAPHAAPNADDIARLTTQEPSLPVDPNAIPPSLEKRIGSDDTYEADVGRGTRTDRSFYGLYYKETSGNYSFKTLFPLWVERKQADDRASLFGFYYNRRSPKVDADILFPAFWHLRDDVTTTTVVGPFMHREAPPKGKEPGRHDNWVAPLFFEGSKTNGSGYFHVPLLGVFNQHTNHDGFNIAGPMYCKWKGGPSCDSRTTDEISMGVAPFYFYGRDEISEYEVIPPLLHYYRYTEAGDSSTNLWGPILTQHSRESDVLNVMPIFWHNWGKNEDHLTVFPFFHKGYKGNSKLLVTPFFVSATGDQGESTFATYLYANYEGRTKLQMVTPFYWHYQDPDIGLDRKLLFPFFYKNTSPRSDDLALFPFYARFKKPGLSETTWVTPLVRHTTDTTGWETDIFPLFYAGRSYNSTHLVAAPFLWDFATATSRSTVVPPVYFRFQDDATITQVALNTYYHEKKVEGGRDWELHVFPFFSYGESPNGHWWNILYGLAGYTREGTMTKMRAAYIPIKLSE
jgi:hypothetical protein